MKVERADLIVKERGVDSEDGEAETAWLEYYSWLRSMKERVPSKKDRRMLGVQDGGEMVGS